MMVHLIMITFMAKLKVYVPDAEIINVNRGGVGKSKNTALKKAFEVSPIVFLSGR